MTEQEYKELKKVLADAPDGASHIDQEVYLKGSNNEFSEWSYGEWDFYTITSENIQSLSDLRTMVEQYERIAELTNALSMALDACYDVDSHGIRHTNSSYVTALKCLEHKDND